VTKILQFSIITGFTLLLLGCGSGDTTDFIIEDNQSTETGDESVPTVDEADGIDTPPSIPTDA
jgi:hypothetical protein